jgi:hypothetical protein
MLTFRNKGKSAGKGAQDAGKELQKLKRQDLLELLLEQMREADRLRGELAASQAQNEDLVALSERLKAKLDDKDAQIDHLKGRLDDKDVALQQVFAIIRNMAVTKKESERLSLLLEAEDVLADRYLHQGEQAETTEEPEAEAMEVVEPGAETVVAIEAEPEVELTEEPELALEPEPVAETLETETVASPAVEQPAAEAAEPQVHQNEAIAAAVPSVDAPAAEPQHIDYLYVDPEPMTHTPSHLAAEGVR